MDDSSFVSVQLEEERQVTAPMDDSSFVSVQLEEERQIVV